MVINKENEEDDKENSDHFTLTNDSEKIFKTVRVRKLTSMTELLENSSSWFVLYSPYSLKQA